MKNRKLNIFCIAAFFMLFSYGAFAQIEFTDCDDPFVIQDPIDWCSDEAQFNNINVGNSGYGPATCWDNENNDVWFEFTAFALAINVTVEAQQGANDLSFVNMALYSGTCGGVLNELECSTGGGIVNLFETGLIIGQKYFIRVNGAQDRQGFFEICTNNYNPPVEPGQDCVTASVLCDKSPFVVQSVTGSGNDTDEAAGAPCIPPGVGQSEDQSTWFKWTAANDGTLTFILTPLRATDDIDFFLYEIPDLASCDKELIRCMATACPGPTGLDETSTDVSEDFNCDSGEDGFLQFVDMVEGQSYALLVNNFTSSGVGFQVEFGGTGEFLGPDPEFEIIPASGLACDQEFTIVNTSSSPMGINIISYEWNFGERAIPGSSSLQNPPPIMYEKFGEKFIVLTVETDKGCIVTEVLPVDAEPCCNDIFDVEINVVDLNDASCPDTPDASFTVEGAGGNPEYEFDIDNSGNFTENGTFDELFAGTYQINVQDIKGCFDSIQVTVGEPDPVIAEAGPDQEAILGFNAQLDGSIEPAGETGTILWYSDPVDSTMSCFTCPDPIVTPPGTTTYYMQVTDENGCVTLDSVLVRVKLERPIYAPNVFTPNQDGFNDRFTLFTNVAAREIELLRVYDRWGNKVYEGRNLPLNDPTVGWDGNFNGRSAQVGVYGWYAEILFIDNVTVDFKGDVTIIR